MAFEASKYFDVFQFTYNAQASAESKLKAKQEFIEVVRKYGTKHAPAPGLGTFWVCVVSNVCLRLALEKHPTALTLVLQHDDRTCRHCIFTTSL